MSSFVALLRAVNVGGTGKLPMTDLKEICEDLGFGAVRTYIGVLVRTAAEMAQVLADNPFPKAAPNRTMAVFLDRAPPPDTLDGIRGQRDEQVQLGRREIYIHYGEGMAASKLVIAAAKTGTARNMNTVATLARMAAES